MSRKFFCGGWSLDKVILYLICIFFVMGGIDYILGNRLELGEKFEEGIKTMGALSLGMIGIYSLSPILADSLAVVFKPIGKIFNIDPSIFTSTFLALDMGGYQIATKLALTENMALFSGIIIAASLGATISFTIPVAFGMLKKHDVKYFSKGVMLGIVAIPIGCFLAGIYEGIHIKMLLWNLLPICIFSLVLVIGLLKAPQACIRVFNVFSKLILVLSILGLLLQGINAICGITIIKGLIPLPEAAYIVVKIAFVLGGAYPMLGLTSRIFEKSLERLGSKFGIDSPAVLGILGGLASNLLIFSKFSEMKPKGKVVATAFG